MDTWQTRANICLANEQTHLCGLPDGSLVPGCLDPEIMGGTTGGINEKHQEQPSLLKTFFRSVLQRSLFLCLLGVLVPQPFVSAHEITPSIVTITLGDDYQADVEIKTNLEALLADIGTDHDDTDDSPQADQYNQLRQLSADKLTAQLRDAPSALLDLIELAFDDRATTLTLKTINVPETGDTRIARQSLLGVTASIPLNATRLMWSSQPTLGDVVLKVQNERGERAASQWIKRGTGASPVNLGGVLEPADTMDVAWMYLELGFTHIVPKGVDHILFVLGLFLLSVQWRPLLYQVTAFTLAHTITLGLAIYGLLRLSPAIVEPLIALSIAYVAVENIAKPRLKPSRIALVFAFGLLHGLGFAGVLEELGLPEGEFLTALISFNVGVEFGQLAVIVGALILIGFPFKNQAWYRQRIVIPASLMIALVGVWWFAERTVL